jgi:YaiO family outer membrane protein
MMHRGTVACALALASVAPVQATAQEDPTPLPWSAVLYYDAQEIAREPDRAYWHTVTTGVQRRLANGSIAIQGIATRRFDLSDQALVIDAYHDLWSGAYANAVVRVAHEAEVLPNYHAGIELFQALGGLEVSGSYQHQEFAVADVNTFGIGTGHYVGAWYLRPRSLVANINDSWSPFFALTARRYLGDTTDDFFDFSLGLGEEVLEVAPPTGAASSVAVITSGSRFASARAQSFLSRHIGGFVGGTYSDYEEIPYRWGVSVGVISRW